MKRETRSNTAAFKSSRLSWRSRHFDESKEVACGKERKGKLSRWKKECRDKPVRRCLVLLEIPLVTLLRHFWVVFKNGVPLKKSRDVCGLEFLNRSEMFWFFFFCQQSSLTMICLLKATSITWTRTPPRRKGSVQEGKECERL